MASVTHRFGQTLARRGAANGLILAEHCSEVLPVMASNWPRIDQKRSCLCYQNGPAHLYIHEAYAWGGATDSLELACCCFNLQLAKALCCTPFWEEH
jgi:hypothetical protein